MTLQMPSFAILGRILNRALTAEIFPSQPLTLLDGNRVSNGRYRILPLTPTFERGYGGFSRLRGNRFGAQRADVVSCLLYWPGVFV